MATAESGGLSTEELSHGIFFLMDEFTQGHETDDATVLVLRPASAEGGNRTRTGLSPQGILSRSCNLFGHFEVP